MGIDSNPVPPTPSEIERALPNAVESDHLHPPNGPIFIVGAMRSGTTLLRLMLDSHPNIALGMETGFLRVVRQIKDNPGFRYGHRWYERYGVTEDEIDSRIAAFYSEVFTSYARSFDKNRWGEKTPLHTWHLNEAATLFPDAAFLAVVRHPAAVVASLGAWSHSWPTVTSRLGHWMNSNLELVRRAGDLTSRMAFVRYEDIVFDTEATLQGILSFLDEPWSDSVLEHHLVQRARGKRGAVEGGTIPDRPIDRTRVDAWRERVDQSTLSMIEAEAGPLMQLFDYPAATAGRTRLATASRVMGPVIPGHEIARRATELGVQLDPRMDLLSDVDIELPNEHEVREIIREMAALKSSRRWKLLQSMGDLSRARRPSKIASGVAEVVRALRHPKQTEYPPP